jgi:hypothetical protein
MKINNDKIDLTRMKDIISQLLKIIHLMCNSKGLNTNDVLEHFTNITLEEREELDIDFPYDTINKK